MPFINYVHTYLPRFTHILQFTENGEQSTADQTTGTLIECMQSLHALMELQLKLMQLKTINLAILHEVLAQEVNDQSSE